MSCLARFLPVVFCVFACFAASPAQADDAREPAIHAVIETQLDAIKADKSDAAFAIASPQIQKMFGKATIFMGMVAKGFPQIYRSSSHKFLNLDSSDGRLWQRVLIQGEKGSSVVVRYDMVEIDGQWRINGCMIEKLDEA